ncbi:MAG: NAD(P)/FAD-dependent oxidoreductase [Pyrinomonadaceae bacterium]
MNYDAIIIGGGAAGLFCAITAGKRRRRVLVIEHNAEVGRKIIISGGGRCNFTNVSVTAENFVSQNPHFAKSALAGYTPQDFVRLVKKHKIQFYEKKLGQLFCRDSSRAIVEMLLEGCRAANVEIRTNCTVREVTRGNNFTVETNQGTFTTDKLVVASGGLSFKKIGASDLGYRIAKQFDIEIVETRPSLVGLVLEAENYKRLAGVSIDAVVRSGKREFRENILFTHRGMSGPAILQISNYWKRNVPVSIDLLPATDVAELLLKNRDSRKRLANFLSLEMPQRFSSEFVAAQLPDKPLNQLTKSETDTVAASLKNWLVKFRDTEGYDRAEVTLGGVSTEELSSKTFEAKRIAGLYFIGEVIDVTGWLGGYNFQWAWSSGFAAGNSI